MKNHKNLIIFEKGSRITLASLEVNYWHFKKCDFHCLHLITVCSVRFSLSNTSIIDHKLPSRYSLSVISKLSPQNSQICV